MEHIRAALRGMLGPDAGVGVTDPSVGGGLWPEEAAAISGAIPKRQTEFAAGRRAARIALAELGVPPTAIPKGADRAPVWPTGISGSISHCADYCIALTTYNNDYPTLGVDVEPATALDHDLIPMICTPVEQVWLTSQPDAALAAKLIFCAKEAVYKAQYPLTGKVIDFHAVTVQITDGHFSIADAPELPNLKGAILIKDGLILSVAHV